MNTTIEKNKVKYSPELEEKLMYMDDENLYCFFEKNVIEYEESLLTVMMRFKNEGI